MLIADHINLLGDNPLIGANDDSLGPRFPDMSAPYDAELRESAKRVGSATKLTLREGVYAAVTGPSFETRAEYRMLRTLGADVVGMSTVPEVIVAVHGGMRVLGISMITDLCLPDTLEPVTLERIVAVANEAEPKLTALVRGVLETHVSAAPRFRVPPADQTTDALELEMLAKWTAEDLLARTIREREGAKDFVFFEGPPTANGRPGIHHVFSRTIKDLFCRYHAMRGGACCGKRGGTRTGCRWRSRWRSSSD